jgi:NitT/TauT family transport system permease protein
VAVLTILVLWGWGVHVSGSQDLAPPDAVARRLLGWAVSGQLVEHVVPTLHVSLVGFAAGGSLGITAPLVLRSLPRLRGALEPYVVASAGIPKYAIVPLLTLWFGIDIAPRLWLVALLVFYPMFIAVVAALGEVNQSRVQAVQVLGGGHAAVVRFVVIPSTFPFLFAGARVAVPRAVSGAIIGEFLIGSRGIGFLIESSRQNADVAGLCAGLVVATTLVVLSTAAVQLGERRALRWQTAERSMSAAERGLIWCGPQ